MTDAERGIYAFLREYENTYKDYKLSLRNLPMTLEGCVVRISDIIGYIGRDIEDAVLLKVFKWEDLPKSISSVLGVSNREIINTIVSDIIDNSFNKNCICMSDNIYKAIKDLKEFNYKNIYSKSMTDSEKDYYRRGMNNIYYKYLEAIKNGDKSNVIYKLFLNNRSDSYLENTDPKRMVIDFIAGMTDDMFLSEIEKVDVY